MIAQLGVPDMRVPIQYALTYPDRYESPVKELDLASAARLTFFEPDYETFECIGICRRAIACGGLMPAAVNSANEQANLLFRQGKIRFLQIPELINAAAACAENKTDFTPEDILALDALMREEVNRRA